MSLRALLSVCGGVFVWRFGVLFLSCVCVCVGGVVLCVCVCVCARPVDIFTPALPQVPVSICVQAAGGALLYCRCVCV